MKYIFLIFIVTTTVFAIDSDKQKHFGVSFAFGTATGIYMDRNYEENSYTTNLIIGTSIAMIPGVLKEVYDDRQDDNDFDEADLAYDFAGSLAGNILGNYLSENLFVDVKNKKLSYNIKF